MMRLARDSEECGVEVEIRSLSRWMQRKYVLGSDVISGDGGICGEENSDKDVECFLLAGS